MFEGMMSEDKNPFTILGDLLKKEDIEMKSFYSMSQVEILTQLTAFMELYAKDDIELYNSMKKILLFYMSSVNSVDGYRSNQIIEALSKMDDKMLSPQLISGAISGNKKK